MQHIKSLFIGTAMGIALLSPAYAQDTAAETVVATVGGEDITIGHMIAMIAGLSEDQQQLPSDVLFEGVLERLIQQRAASQSVEEPSQGAQLMIENERHALIASLVVEDLAGQINVSEEKIQSAYDRRFADFTPSHEFNASHILVETEDAAKEVIAELEGGADFAELAKLKSTGPSGPGGGNLGWFGKGRMVPSFEAAVEALEDGQVSGPVQTQFGWHVILLNESQLPEAPTLEDLRQELATEVWQEELRTGVADLVEAAGVDRKDTSGIDPSILRQPGLVDF